MDSKLLIVEEALRDLKGHWFGYIKTIEEAATANKWQVEVAAHQDVVPEISRELCCFPLFKSAHYLSNQRRKMPGERYYGFILHSLRSLKVLWPFLKKHYYDAVFLPTVLVQHLLAWYIIMRLHPNKPEHVTLFFVTPPGVWNSKAKMTVFPKTAIVLKRLLKLFTKLVNGKKVTLAVETKEAKAQFEKLTGLPFTLMPHPVPTQDTAVASTGTINGNPVQSFISFGCFGFARHEKGSDLLKTAIEQILRKEEDFKIHFTVQWTDPFAMPDGSICTPGPLLDNHSQVTIINGPMGGSDYDKLLSQTNCMILPYRNESYHARVSRVAIEAVCNGIPVIYTKGGWLEENVENFGAGVGIADESVEELIAAIKKVSADSEEFSKRAKERVQKARAYYAPDHFFKILTKHD